MSTVVIQPKATEFASYSVREFFRESRDRENTMAILHAYFDDSSDSKHQRFMAVGGLVGVDAQFTDLDIYWSHETNGLAPFRSTECETQHGQFKNWSKRDCDSLMARLVSAIRKSHLLAYGSVVPVDDYRQVFPNADEYDPYFLALRHTIINMAFVGSVRSDGTDKKNVDVKICVEDSDATSRRALRVYNELKAFSGWTWGRSLAGFSTASKKLMALQGADLMAREAYKHADNLGVRKTRKPVKALHDKTHFHIWNRSTLEHLRDAGGPTNLNALTHWGDTGKPPSMASVATQNRP